MTNPITIPIAPLAALVLAATMTVHAAVLASVLADDDAPPLSWWETLFLAGGWLWWAYLLWGVVADA